MNNTPGGISDLSPFVDLLKKLGRKDLAKEVLDTFAKVSSTVEQYDNLAKCYFDLKYYEDSIVYAEKALPMAGTPGMIYALKSNLVNVYNHANYPEKALRTIKQLEAINPADTDILLEKSYSKFLMNEKDEAEDILRKSLANIDQENEEMITKIKFNLGTYHLYRDEFLIGMKLFLEEGAKLKFWNVENIFARSDSLTKGILSQKYKKWDGSTIPGATIICHAEAGIGDEIINLRFLKLIKDRGMNPVWYSDLPSRKDLEEVFIKNGINVITDISAVKDHPEVFYVYSMHLPVVLQLGYKDLWYGPYIKSNESYVDKWAKILNKSDGRKKIAIRWQGNPDYDQDLHRSVPLKEIYEAVKHIDADFYSLQLDNGLEELDDFPGLVDLSDKIKTWDDTFALIDNMDIVITSCTSVAHASGAMGARTMVFVPISAYYTWSHSMEQSPWYGDNVTILRQVKPRSWIEPREQLKELLEKTS